MSTVLWQTADMSEVQSMGYVITTDNGRTVVIDGGNDCETREILQLLGGRAVDAWFLTHAHRDHISVLCRIIEEKLPVEVRRVYYNFLPEEFIAKYAAFNLAGIQRFKRIEPLLADRAVTLREGTEIKIDNLTFKVLSEPDLSVNYENCVNESSVAIRMDTGRHTVLFLGDLGPQCGAKLLEKHRDELKSEYVQMAHHGQYGVEKDVYEAISPRVCLWPACRRIWDNDNGDGFDTWVCKTITTRKWMDELGVKEHYISMNGIYRFVL